MRFHFGSSKNRQLTYKTANWVFGITNTPEVISSSECWCWSSLGIYTVTVMLPSPFCTCPGQCWPLCPTASAGSQGQEYKKCKLLRGLVSWIDFPKGSDQSQHQHLQGHDAKAMIKQTDSIEVYHLQGPRESWEATYKIFTYTHILGPKPGARTAWPLA